MAGITLNQIMKSFADTEVLKGIDIDIPDGEFLTLVGPSGCGKSTLLRIIAGLESQDSGDVAIDGVEVNAVRASKRDLAMVFQSYALYPHLTVRQNMETPLRMRDLNFWERLPVLGAMMAGRRDKFAAINDAVSDVSDILKIKHLLQRKPGQLSGGQRQRVALGRAMVRKPAAFLMDEPLSNLDSALRVHMRSELAELHRSLGVTFVYVTHDQAEALTMSDRMAVMMDGEILQLGAPDEIYRNPQNRRVAEFIGSPKINLYPGEVDSTGRLMAFGAPLKRRVPGGTNKVSIGVRPEHFQLVDDQSDNEQWPFTVTHKENLGSDFFLHGHINGSSQRTVARATPSAVANISIGEQIFLRPVPNATMVFGENDQRIHFHEGEL